MVTKPNGKKIAIVVTDGFEQVEMTEPRRALEEAGFRTSLVTPKGETVRGMRHKNPGDSFEADLAIAAAQPDDFDGLVLPGGVANPDALRLIPEVVRFVASFGRAGKPIGAICHGPWTLIDAGLVRGKRVTSWPSLKIDLTNAGAEWVDEEVVVDGLLITSRKPDDIPAFNRALIMALSTNGAMRAADASATRTVSR